MVNFSISVSLYGTRVPSRGTRLPSDGTGNNKKRDSN